MWDRGTPGGLPVGCFHLVCFALEKWLAFALHSRLGDDGRIGRADDRSVMIRGRIATALAVLGAGVLAMGVTGRNTSPVDYCHTRLSVMGRKFFHQWSGEVSMCQQRRLRGLVDPASKCYPDQMDRVDASTFCQAPDDPLVDSSYQRRLCRAEQHSHQKIQRKCTEEDLSQIDLGVPCGTVATVAELQDCIDFAAHGQNAIDFTRTVYGTVDPTSDAALRTCLQTMFEAGQVYARKVMKTVGDQCEVFVMQGRARGPCPDEAAQKRLKKARRVFAQTALGVCQPYFSQHQLPLGPPCDHLIGRATPSEYVECIAAAAEGAAMRGISTIWHGG